MDNPLREHELESAAATLTCTSMCAPMNLKRARMSPSPSSLRGRRDRSPAFLWYCYFVLVAQLRLASQARAYSYSYSSPSPYAWAGTGSGSSGRSILGAGSLRGVLPGQVATSPRMLLRSTNWNAAVPAFPAALSSANANDPSRLCMSQQPLPVAPRVRSRVQAPSMFASGKFRAAGSIALLPAGQAGSGTGNARGRTPVRRPVHARRGSLDKAERRVLGFDVLALAATPSNVNMDTWKSADSGVSDSGSFFSSPAATMDVAWNSLVSESSASAHSSRLDLDLDLDLPAGLPWTPSRLQIDSLKVIELKRACEERGLQRSGNKAALRDRLWNWVLDQRNQNQVKITGDFLTRYFEDSATTTSTQHHDKHSANAKPAATSNMATSTPNSLADWARNVDLEPLLQKRKEIHRQKREGRPVTPKQTSQRQQPQTAEYLKSLARALKAPSSPFASNIKVKELYTASKQADQLGERMVAVDLLRTLLMVTPSDARVYRRLARMYTEQGDFVKARETLQAGLQRQKLNPWLWHGLGQLERNHGTLHLSREYFEKAIECDPTFAHSYHALGSMEHSKGNIANATRIIKKGLEYCPTNHRLWHACGDVYRAAQMMEDADRSYRRALKHGPPMSHCFAYTSLAAVAYEQGQIDLARSWLVKTLRVNNGRHAQGWVALAQLEEAEGRIQKAQLVCTSAIAQYERGLLEARQRFLRKNGQRSPEVPLKASNSTSSVEITNQLLRSVPRYRSGDKFVHVYRNWARLEERHGTVESVDRVYERAQIAFPQEYKLLLSWAHYHSSMFNHERARIIFQEACSKVGHRHADPYRMSAELEMSLSNFQDARKILFLGARAVMESNNDAGEDKKGLPQLLHTWAVCEWHLGNLDRAEVLFDNALRLMETEGGKSPLRSCILYSIARLRHHRGKLYAAQHFIALALKENSFPGGNGLLWALWAEIASGTGNEKLENECLAQCTHAEENKSKEDEFSPLLRARSSSEASAVKPNVENLLRRDPWRVKLFNKGSDSSTRIFSRLRLPLEQSSAYCVE